jgi:hypothetical protein
MWIGRFGSFDEYKRYMKVRLALGKAYGAMGTKASVALQMEEYIEMARLDRDDLRSSTPSSQV